MRLITGLLRNRITEVLNGSAPPKLPSTDAIVPVKPPAPPTTMSVFLVRHSNNDGNQRKSCAFVDIEVPLAVGERALRVGAAVAMNDPARKAQHGRHQLSHPQPHTCVDLDIAEDLELTEPAPAPVFRHVHRASYKASFTV